MSKYELIKQRYLSDMGVKFKAKDMLRALDSMDPIDALRIIDELRFIFDVKASEVLG